MAFLLLPLAAPALGLAGATGAAAAVDAALMYAGLTLWRARRAEEAESHTRQQAAEEEARRRDAEVAREAVKATERSDRFVDAVERFDPAKGCVGADTSVLERAGIILSEDPQQRKTQLVETYTGHALFRDMNRCLREDDGEEMKYFSGYIRELREVFRTDDPSPVVTFYAGTLHRGISLSSSAVADYVKSFVPGDDFVWAAFTSTSKSRSAAFTGDVCFQIKCSANIDGARAQYAPATVSHLSWHPDEAEVLFPPHVRFRVVNTLGNTVFLETAEFPSVWELIERSDWSGFKKWAQANPERVDSTGCAKSVINTVAAKYAEVPAVEVPSSSPAASAVEVPASVPAISAADQATLAASAPGQAAAASAPAVESVNPLQVCLECNVNFNEKDPQTGATPALIFAKAVKAAQALLASSAAGAAPPGDVGNLAAAAQSKLEFTLAAGGCPYLKDDEGQAAVDVVPGVAELASKVPLKKVFRWEYYVDDHVDQKETGWYPYEQAKWECVEGHYEQWRRHLASGTPIVRSKGDSSEFAYAIDFENWTQCNTEVPNRTVRRIRRVVHS